MLQQPDVLYRELPRPFFDFDGPADRDEYIAKLRNCRVGFHGGTRWAMSSQDGLCKGIPYVYEIGKETGELFGSQMETGFSKNSDAVDLFNRILDDNDWRNKQSQLALDHCSNVHTWSNGLFYCVRFIYPRIYNPL